MQRIELLSSLLWWELGTNSLITGPGEWLSFRRFTSKLSWSWFCLLPTCQPVLSSLCSICLPPTCLPSTFLPVPSYLQTYCLPPTYLSPTCQPMSTDYRRPVYRRPVFLLLCICQLHTCLPPTCPPMSNDYRRSVYRRPVFLLLCIYQMSTADLSTCVHWLPPTCLPPTCLSITLYLPTCLPPTCPPMFTDYRRPVFLLLCICQLPTCLPPTCPPMSTVYRRPVYRWPVFLYSEAKKYTAFGFEYWVSCKWLR